MKCMVVGVKRVAGISKATKNPFDMSRVLGLIPVSPVSREDFQVSGAGFEQFEINADARALAEFQGLDFPVEVTLRVEHRAGRRGLEPVCVGIED